jgi:hypothetical protein
MIFESMAGLKYPTVHSKSSRIALGVQPFRGACWGRGGLTLATF